MTESRNTIEALFTDALREALETVLSRAAAEARPEDPGPLGLGIPEAAELLGVTETAMRDLCRRRDFPAVKVSGKYLVSRAGLANWLEAQTGGGEKVG